MTLARASTSSWAGLNSSLMVARNVSWVTFGPFDWCAVGLLSHG